MEGVIYSFLLNITKESMWSGVVALVPFIVIIFVLCFCIHKLKEFLNDFNDIWKDYPDDDEYDTMNRYSSFREKYDI